MKVLVVAPYAYNRYHFETDLELAQTHIDDGDDVSLLECRSHLAACDINIDHQPEICLSCLSRCRRGVDALSTRIPILPFVQLAPADHEIIKNMRTNFVDQNDLKSYEIQSLDIGYSVLSSLVSQFRNPNPSLVEQSDRIRRLLVASVSVYLSMKRLLNDRDFDRVYVFNGRHAPLRGVLRACQEHEVDCFLHERGSSIEKYTLYENSLPHEINRNENRIRKTWEAAPDDAQRRRIARDFFTSSASGRSMNWISFVEHQEPGYLPETWNPDHNNVVIFTSSEDEMVAIGDEWQNPIYLEQIDGLERIEADARTIAGLHLFVRIHPNLRNLENQDIKRALALQRDGFDVIPADSEINSYDLLRNADRVLTFGSSMGIEAAYWGIPSILAGNSFYRGLGSTYNPENHDEVMDLLIKKIEPLDNFGALMLGYYRATFGIPFLHYRPTGIFEGRFRERLIRASWIAHLIEKYLRSPFGRPFRFLIRTHALRRMDRRPANID